MPLTQRDSSGLLEDAPCIIERRATRRIATKASLSLFLHTVIPWRCREWPETRKPSRVAVARRFAGIQSRLASRKRSQRSTGSRGSAPWNGRSTPMDIQGEERKHADLVQMLPKLVWE